MKTNQTVYSSPSLLKRITCVLAALLMFALPAFATPTALSTIVLVQNNVAVTAGQLVITFTACDNVNGNSFISTGREVLFVQNSAGGAGTFTVTSVPDALGRSDTSLTAYSLAAGAFAAVQMKYQTGWISGTSVTLACSAATMKFAVVQYN
jgi:hypothetical protein